jgi:hypothetical protein
MRGFRSNGSTTMPATSSRSMTGNFETHGFIDVNIDRDKPEIQADSDIAPGGLGERVDG